MIPTRPSVCHQETHISPPLATRRFSPSITTAVASPGVYGPSAHPNKNSDVTTRANPDPRELMCIRKSCKQMAFSLNVYHRSGKTQGHWAFSHIPPRSPTTPARTLKSDVRGLRRVVSGGSDYHLWLDFSDAPEVSQGLQKCPCSLTFRPSNRPRLLPHPEKPIAINGRQGFLPPQPTTRFDQEDLPRFGG